MSGPRVSPPSWAGFAIAAAIPLAFLASGPRDAGAYWFARGSADASAILSGEVWRLATALTLHADWAHALGNAAAAALFATAVCRLYGPGAGAAMILVTGLLGNLENALWHQMRHSSVGASTALFGAVGILAGNQFVRRRGRRRERTRAWIPLAGGLGLVAMLGTGGRADLSAHLFGLATGTLIGVAAGIGLARPPGRTAQGLLAAGSIALLSLAWVAALT